MPMDIIQNRYELKQRMGSGSMGAVYLAFDRLTGDDVALKQVVTTQEIATVDSTTANLALAQEFQVLASLRHPNIIGVLDYGFYDKSKPFFTMSFVQSARNMRTAATGHAVKERVLLLVQLLNGLVYLERRGIVHRDLKPDNILITLEDQVKVVDFGLARAHQQIDSAEVGGTLTYIAPEIFEGKPPSAASDLYAVGVIAYEILAQQPLYRNITSVSELIQHAVKTYPDFKPLLSSITRMIDDSPATAPAENASYPQDTLVLKTDPIETGIFPLESTRLYDEDNTELTPINKTTQLHLPQTTLESSVAPDIIEGDEPAFQLARVVQKLLAKKPIERYQHAEDVIADLCRAIDVPQPPQSRAIRESFLQAAHFTGREAEFERLSDSLTAALNGQGGVFFIGGESGVGKSRLLSELRHLALVKGVVVLSGQSVRESPLVYQGWREPIRRLTLYGDVSDVDAQSLKPLIPDLERLLKRTIADDTSTDHAVEKTTAAVLNLFRNCHDPILLLLEDWQWAPAESREILKRLQDYALSARLLIVVSYRNDEAPALPELYPNSTTLILERLNATHVEELASSILGRRTFRSEFINTLHQHTEGNVFFLIEVIRVLAEEAGRLEDIINITLPASLITGGMSQIIQRRLEKVPRIARALLDSAAIAGREMDLKLLRELNKNQRIDFEDWLTSVTNAAVVEYRDEVWRFSHDKLRQHVLSQIEPDRQKTIHRQIAEALEHLYPAHEQAFALVRHWNAAGNRVKELHYIRIAGEQATRYNNYDEARQLYERALAITSNPLFLIEFNTLLAGVCEFIGQYERGMQCLEIVLTLGRKHNQKTALAKAAHELAWIYMRQGDMVQAHQHAEEALTMARESKQDLLAVRALSVLGVIHVIQGNYAQSRQHLEDALPLVKTLDNAYLHATILNTLGAAYEGEQRVADAIQVLQQAGYMAEELRDRELMANIHGNLGRILYLQTQFTQAEQSFLTAVPGFTEVGNVYGTALANAYLGLIAVKAGRSSHAKAYFQEAVHASHSIGAQTITLLSLCGIAALHFQRGERSRTLELIGWIRAQAASADDVDIQREIRSLASTLALSEEELQATTDRAQTLDFDGTLTQEFQALSDVPPV